MIKYDKINMVSININEINIKLVLCGEIRYTYFVVIKEINKCKTVFC